MFRSKFLAILVASTVAISGTTSTARAEPVSITIGLGLLGKYLFGKAAIAWTTKTAATKVIAGGATGAAVGASKGAAQAHLRNHLVQQTGQTAQAAVKKRASTQGIKGAVNGAKQAYDQLDD